MSIILGALGRLEEGDPIFFSDGGLVPPSTGLGGSLGGSIMSTSRPSSILGIGQALSPFNPASFQVVNTSSSYQPGNRSEATQFRRDFLRETGSPALGPDGQFLNSRSDISNLIDRRIAESAQPAYRRQGAFGPFRRVPSYRDGGLFEEGEGIEKLLRVPVSSIRETKEKNIRPVAGPVAGPVAPASDNDRSIGLGNALSIANRMLNPKLPSYLNPLSDEEVRVRVRPNIPGSMQRINFTFPFQEGGLVDSGNSPMATELMGQEEELAKMLFAATSDESKLSDPEREEILLYLIDTIGEDAVMSLMQSMAQQGSIGDGMSDSVNARLSHGEFVIPADAVAHAGDGSTPIGAKRFDNLVRKLRDEKTGKEEQPAPLEMNEGGLAKYLYRDGGLYYEEKGRPSSQQLKADFSDFLQRFVRDPETDPFGKSSRIETYRF